MPECVFVRSIYTPPVV